MAAKQLIPVAEGEETIERYGQQWPADLDDLSIELSAFLLALTPEEGGLGSYWHCRNVIDMLWNHEESTMKFDWTTWAERMIEEACQNKFLSVAGCASSGKSDAFAVYAIVCYLADPANTRVMVTSTTLKDSKLRIWGRIREYWDAVPGLPGQPVDSQGMIKYVNPETGKVSDGSGIILIAGEAQKEKESLKKLIGFKRARVIVIADELPELSPTIIDAALGNLNVNPFFQLIGIGNPNSRFDAHGVFSEPVDGWGSISLVEREWKTKLGKCIRFDGLDSPNIREGRVLYSYLIKQDFIDTIIGKYGEDSLLYWRMCRGFWSPTGSAAGLYSEADIANHGGKVRGLKWATKAERVAFLDTAFTTGGDRAMAYLGWCGETVDGKKVLVYDEEGVLLAEQVTNPKAFSFQIAEQFRDLCVREGVSIDLAGTDVTGGGAVFADVLATVWGTGFHRVLFSAGPATDRPASSSDPRPCSEVFMNRVSELWGVGVSYLRSGQIKGIGTELAREMISRLYTTKQRGLIEVEPKKKMKARIGFSPDVADAAFGLLDVCRERLGFECDESVSASAQDPVPRVTWDEFVAAGDSVYREDSPEGLDFIPLSFS